MASVWAAALVPLLIEFLLEFFPLMLRTLSTLKVNLDSWSQLGSQLAIMQLNGRIIRPFVLSQSLVD